MKQSRYMESSFEIEVAPLAGAWIETFVASGHSRVISVAPLAGAWIETRNRPHKENPCEVAPLAGAWIETPRVFDTGEKSHGRPPRGGVD